MDLYKLETEKIFFISLAFVLVALIFAITFYKIEQNRDRNELLKAGNLEECPIIDSFGNVDSVILVKDCKVIFTKDLKKNEN